MRNQLGCTHRVLVLVVLASCWACVHGQLNLKPFTRPYNILEDTIVETQIAFVDCTNPGDYCLCNIKNYFPSAGPFTVWKKTPTAAFFVYYTGLASGERLSFRTTPSYFLTITCHDTTNTEINETIIEIDVMPNQAPRFTNKNYPDDTLILDADKPYPGNTIIYNVSATDDDKDPIFYSFTTIPPVNYFTIGLADGIMRTAVDLRTATVDHIVMTVSVTDGVNTVNNFNIIITIQNLNTRPMIDNLPQTVSILETATSGTVIATLSIDDPDIFVQQLIPTCTVIPNSEQYKFMYDPGTRNIRLSTLANAAMPLDYERVNRYTITCVVSDGFLDSQNDVLTVLIENVNEPPVFDELAYYCELYESNAGISTCDIDANIVDPEGDTIVSVGFLRGNNSERFIYDRSTSQVTFAVDYDVDQNVMTTGLVLQLQATDANGASKTVPVYIRVRDVNDNTCNFGPTSVNTFRADQSTPLGSLGTFIATDDDLTTQNNQLSYELIRALPAESTNYLGAYPDGTLAYIGTIPPEYTGRSFSLIVRCKDSGSPPRSSEGTVVLTYQVTTTTSTSTTTSTTTTTTTTTPTTTTTTSAPSTDIWDNDAFVAIFAILMALLILGLLVGTYFLLRACGMFSGLGAITAVSPATMAGVEAGEAAAQPAKGLCGDFCCPRPPPPEKDDYFNTDVRTNNDFRDLQWNKTDKYETGIGYKPEGDPYGKALDFGPRRLALPAPRSVRRY